VNDGVDLRERLFRKKIGDRVNITFYRSGKKKTAEVKLTEADRLQKLKNSPDFRAVFY
ncbi:PDZ domain-containing protein, partial [Lysinibacillus sp. D4A1_S13]|uniref:PDZ domain-containing protein n=1 Tax=Lysinibacillus sp. D4A1_S13 TaxID=2941228 RepID=UPI0020BDA813